MVIKVYSQSTCNPCKLLKKSLQEASFASNIEFILLDDNPGLARELNIRTVPTTILYDASGNEVQRISGNNPVEIKKAVEATGSIS